MSSAPFGEAEYRSLRTNSLIGLVAVLVFLGGLIVWAGLTGIAGAVVAQGIIVVQGYPKSVQHREGGIVEDIFVDNEERVSKGQLLVMLDTTEAAATLEALEAQLRAAIVKEARLVAELAGNTEIQVPRMVERLGEDDEVTELTQVERQLLTARVLGRSGLVGQLYEQISQLERQIEGLEIERSAIEQQIDIIAGEISDFDQLFADRLIPASRGTALNKELAESRGRLGQIVAAIAEARATIAEREIQISQIDNDFRSTALDELQQLRSSIIELQQRIRAAEDKLSRAEIRAPQAGIVHQLRVHTIGGVLPPGETVLAIVPQDTALQAELRIRPVDIDKVEPGQEVKLRLSSFDQRVVPELDAYVVTVAPDRSQDPATGQDYYTARVSIPEMELSATPFELSLVPGMPLEAFVKTQERTILSYLFDPFSRQLALALRED